MGECSEAFVAFDVAKMKHAVAVAEGGRTGEVRFLGEVENRAGPIERTVRKLAGRYGQLHFCFEAGPTGYGLYRQLQALGHDCMVVAPALIPRRPGERVKTNRRDAVTLARLHRAGELIGVWVPDAVHEAVRDLVRAREAAEIDARPDEFVRFVEHDPRGVGVKTEVPHDFRRDLDAAGGLALAVGNRQNPNTASAVARPRDSRNDDAGPTPVKQAGSPRRPPPYPPPQAGEGQGGGRFLPP